MRLFLAEEPLQPWQNPAHTDTQTLLIFYESLTAALDVLMMANDR